VPAPGRIDVPAPDRRYLRATPVQLGRFHSKRLRELYQLPVAEPALTELYVAELGFRHRDHSGEAADRVPRVQA